MELSFTVKSSIRIQSPGFPADEMRANMLLVRDVVRSRILSGVNLQDAGARPLVAGYVRAKVRKGGVPIRNWKLTGALMNALDVTRSTDNYATIGFHGEDQRTKARFLQAGGGYRAPGKQGGIKRWKAGPEPMFGLSPNDRRAASGIMRASFFRRIADVFTSRKAA